ncbi:MAG: hypothetical protein AAF423_10995 [Pseudomonadota bacterium]
MTSGRERRHGWSEVLIFLTWVFHAPTFSHQQLILNARLIGQRRKDGKDKTTYIGQ